MRHRAPAKKPPALMLTSLLDMFTIILIFLIVSFSNEDYNFKLRPDLKLPESTAHSVFKPAVNMAVTEAGVFVAKKKIFSLDHGKAPADDYDAGQIDAVVQAMTAAYKAHHPNGDDAAAKAKAKDDQANQDDQGDSADSGDDQTPDADIVVIQADKGLSYKTLYLVMRSARIAGFDKYRLAIMKK